MARGGFAHVLSEPRRLTVRVPSVLCRNALQSYEQDFDCVYHVLQLLCVPAPILNAVLLHIRTIGPISFEWIASAMAMLYQARHDIPLSMYLHACVSDHVEACLKALPEDHACVCGIYPLTFTLNVTRTYISETSRRKVEGMVQSETGHCILLWRHKNQIHIVDPQQKRIVRFAPNELQLTVFCILVLEDTKGMVQFDSCGAWNDQVLSDMQRKLTEDLWNVWFRRSLIGAQRHMPRLEIRLRQ